jgi:hypothetical protein
MTPVNGLVTARLEPAAVGGFKLRPAVINGRAANVAARFEKSTSS